MPLLDTTSTKCGGCELDDENRMPSHRGLFSVILGKIKGNSGIYKLKCVLFDGFETFGGNLIPVFLKQFEFGSKFGFSKGGELLRYS